MKKIAFVLILFIIVLNGCQLPETEKTPAEISLSDIQVTACNEAYKAGTCDTRLAELGIVMKEECCEVLNKCCQ